MSPDELAMIHRAAFTRTRAWSADEFSDILDSAFCFLVTNDESFALGRVIGPEVELLTLAVAPVTQRKGLGRKCLSEFEQVASHRGAKESFLEVADDNVAAINLYKSAGYKQISKREKYYETEDGVRVDALIFRKSL